MNPYPLFTWMRERHHISLRREAGQRPPWTTDPVLRQFHFCEVFRERDRTTMWIHQHIRLAFRDHPHLWFLLVAARFFNWVPTLRLLLDEGALPLFPLSTYDPAALAGVIRKRKRTGLNVFSRAYMIRSRPRVAKGDYVAHEVLGSAWAQRDLVSAELHGDIAPAVAALDTLPGLAGFMAYEVATDLRWCPGWLLDAQDKMTYANMGPGALRGLNRLQGWPVNETRPQWKALEDARALLEAIRPVWADYWARADKYTPVLELRDIEHSLCEYDKYCRAQDNGGKGLRRHRASTPSLTPAERAVGP